MASRRGSDTDEIKQTMLGLLPDDGTPVLNRVMRLVLARRLERAVDQDLYFKVRDALVAEGVAGRLRGQGGQVFRILPDEGQSEAGATAPEPVPAESWPEKRLMEPLRRYLEGPFGKGLDLPKHSAVVVQDTSALGASRGRWARPDFILVSAMRFRLMPGCQVDLHAFELKTEAGGGVLAIHEALAQTRFTHFGHLVWHLPDGAGGEAMLDDIVTHCEEHGIGLIRMRDPERAGTDGCEILVDPRRKPTLPAVVDGFLETRLTEGQKAALLGVVRSTP